MVHQMGPRHRVRTYSEPHVVRRRPWPYHVCCGGARTRASVSGAALSLHVSPHNVISESSSTIRKVPSQLLGW